MAHILIIEDEPELASGLRDNLEFEGHTVTHAPDGEQGLQAAAERQPDLVLLDIMLPGIDGFEVCLRLRRNGFTAPILILSARGQEIDKVRGLELGADDYITKPFGLKELLARIQASLRRIEKPATPSADTFQVGDRTVDLKHQKVVGGPDGEVPLGYYETEILRMLHGSVNVAVQRAALLEQIWGVGMGPVDRTVDNHIVSLRRKLEPDPKKPQYLLTAHAVGYKLVL